MGRHKKLPAVREDEFALEIDQVKGEYPFLKFIWGHDEKDRTRLIVIANSNERGEIVGQNERVAILAISPKKAERLKEFLDRTLDQVPS